MAIRALILALIFLPSCASAQTVWACGSRDTVIATLSEKYGESRIGGGLRGPMAIFEVWASETGTWTFLKTTPDGVTCVIASGDNWRSFEKEEGGI